MTAAGELIVAATCGAICVFSIAVGAVCWFVLRVADNARMRGSG